MGPLRRQMDDVFGRALGDERAGPPAAAGPTGHDIRRAFAKDSRLWRGWTPPVGALRGAPRPIGYEPARDRGTRGDVAPDAADHGHAPDLVAGAWDGEGHVAGRAHGDQTRSEDDTNTRAGLGLTNAQRGPRVGGDV